MPSEPQKNWLESNKDGRDLRFNPTYSRAPNSPSEPRFPPILGRLIHFLIAAACANCLIHNLSRRYTFELPLTPHNTHGVLGLSVGRHIQVSVHFADQAVLRSYTPIRPVLPSEEDGTFDLLVKTYLPSKDFPPGGTMSNYLDTMNLGAFLLR